MRIQQTILIFVFLQLFIGINCSNNNRVSPNRIDYEETCKLVDIIPEPIMPDTIFDDTSLFKNNPFTNWNFPLINLDVEKMKPTYKTYLPYFDDTNCYIVDENGETISNNRYENIILDENYPFYWVKIDEHYFLYTYPEIQVLSDAFKSTFKIEFPLGCGYSFGEKVKDKEFNYYYFTEKTRNGTKSKFMSLDIIFELGCTPTVGNTRLVSSPKLPHRIVVGENCKMKIIDKNGNLVVPNSFDEFIYFEDTYRYLKIKSGEELGIVDMEKRRYLKINFQPHYLEYAKDSDGLFYAKAEGEDMKYLVIDLDGNILLTSEWLTGVYEGHASVYENKEYRFYDVINHELLKTVKRKDKKNITIRRHDGKNYMVHNGTVMDLDGDTLNIDVPWRKITLLIKSKLDEKLKKNFPNAKEARTLWPKIDKYFEFKINKTVGLMQDDGIIKLAFAKYESGNPISLSQLLANGAYLSINDGTYLHINDDFEIIKWSRKNDEKRLKFNPNKAAFTRRGNKPIKRVNLDNDSNGYLFYEDEKFVHIFSTAGKYISSHEGTFDRQLSHLNLGGSRTNQRSLSPIIAIKHHHQYEYNYLLYFVRLTDGVELFKKNENHKSASEINKADNNR